MTEQLTRWLAIQDQLTTALAEGPDILTVEQSHAQGQLRALATHPRLRAGLLLASPSLDRYLPTYLDTPAGPLGKRAAGSNGPCWSMSTARPSRRARSPG